MMLSILMRSFSHGFPSIIQQENCHIFVWISCNRWGLYCAFRIQTQTSALLDSIRSDLFFTDGLCHGTQLEVTKGLSLSQGSRDLENFLTDVKSKSFSLFGDAGIHIERFLEDVFAEYRKIVPFVRWNASTIFSERSQSEQPPLEAKSAVDFASKL